MSLISMHQALFDPDRSVYRYACLKNETKSERVLSCSLSPSLFHIDCGPQPVNWEVSMSHIYGCISRHLFL